MPSPRSGRAVSPLRFATNTTSRPRRRILERLHRLGFDVAPGELITPAALAVRRCADRGHRTVALVMKDELREDFAGLVEGGDAVDAVILGDCGEEFGYALLNRAFRLLMDGAELIALQRNRYWLTPDGLSLDVGPFVAALEYAASTEAFVVGKPAPAFFASALDGTGAAAAEAAMVGDDIESDVGGALRRRDGRHPRAHREVPRGIRARRRDPADGDHRLDRRPAGAARRGRDGLILRGRARS